MRFFTLLSAVVSLASATIYQNDQIRDNPYPGQASIVYTQNTTTAWKTYGPDSCEISYKGRWDSKYISWWSAPGVVFAFTGQDLALDFGPYTSPGVLVAYRIDGLDWQFSNVTANSTYQFISPATTGLNLTSGPVRFEMRVTNWAYGVQLAGVKVSGNNTISAVKPYSRTIEVIGDSLTAGQYTTYEGISSWGWGVVNGLGNTEFSIEAYPGICLTNKKCYGNLNGQTYQFYQTSDTSGRAYEIYPDGPEPWDFSKHPAADLTIINIGTNDNNTSNNITATEFYNSYIELIDGLHKLWPDTKIIIFSLWSGFGQVGSTYVQGSGFYDEIIRVADNYKDQDFVYYFNTTGILNHNDIGPLYHPTDVGAIKVAAQVQQYIVNTFGWEVYNNGPEVQSHTLYWNDQSSY